MRGGEGTVTLQPVVGDLRTTFEQAEGTLPGVRLGDDPALQLSVGNLSVNGASMEVGPVSNVEQDRTRLSMKEVYGKLAGHVTRVDHTGINLPMALVSREQWEVFVSSLAGQTNLYEYPTGEPWLFVLPATQAEFGTDITDFPLGREPRFELVYDEYSPMPTIQIDIGTDLTRREVKKLFPEPFGISFPDLAEYFRTVYLWHEWPGLDIRFDIRFNNEDPGSWETGEWLVTEGGRVR